MTVAAFPARWLAAASLVVLIAGFLALLAYCIVEAFVNPGRSLVDAYWTGRLPWMAIAEVTIVVGATAGILTGGAAILLAGRWWQRLLAVPAVLVAALWWLLAMAMSTMRAVPCLTGHPCPAPDPDPWAYAYSAPETAALFLILPALVVLMTVLLLPRVRGAERPG
jgi:hypothetical protein